MVKGDPGDGLGIPSLPNQNEKRDCLDLEQKPYCGDPEDGLGNLFEGYSIDLKGNKLGPEHIVQIEEN